MPSGALAIASSRRATRASDFLLASLRSTTGDRSLRIHSAVILPSSNQSEGNHEPDPLGIAPRQQESSLSTPGISRRLSLAPLAPTMEADLAGPGLALSNQLLVVRVSSVPCRRSCGPHP